MASKTNKGMKIDMPTVEDILGDYNPDVNGAVQEIAVSQLDNYKGNKFPVIDNAPSMIDLIESIRENGVTNPVPVFLKEDGRYQLCTGHRRKRACELLGMETIPCYFTAPKSDAELEVFNNESNISREELPVMKKAEIVVSTYDKKRIVRVEKGLKEEPEDESKDTYRQVTRFRRILSLVRELHSLVDSEKIGVVAAENLSYLNEDEQREVAKVLVDTGKKLSKSNSEMLREGSRKKQLSPEEIKDILTGQKRVRVRKNAKLEVSRKVQDEIPPDVKPNEYEGYIIRAIRYMKAHENEMENVFEEGPSAAYDPSSKKEEKSTRRATVAIPK